MKNIDIDLNAAKEHANMLVEQCFSDLLQEDGNKAFQYLAIAIKESIRERISDIFDTLENYKSEVVQENRILYTRDIQSIIEGIDSILEKIEQPFPGIIDFRIINFVENLLKAVCYNPDDEFIGNFHSFE